MTKLNKEGWEYKKLGEVATFLNGYAFKPEQWGEKGLPIIRIQNLNTPTAPYNYYSQSLDEKYLVKNGDLLISWSASLGTYVWEGEDAYLNQHIFKVVFDKLPIEKMFLKYLVTSKLEEMTSLVHGATMKHITKKNFDNINIPLPPLPIQHHIVEELDEINAIISAKKQQLSKLDELAQSIFYNMFGDPVTNEKGWEVKTFKQCFSLKSGDGLSAKNFVDGQYPVYGGNGIAGYHNAFNKEGQNIIIGRVGALCGNIRLVEGQIFVTDNAFVLSTNENFEAATLLYLLRFLNLRQFARDALQPVISNTSLKDIKVILPPLPLQETFAARVSAIEDEKAAIAASIEEMETLLASRMDYWFN